MSENKSNQIGLVTGGGRGIGEATCLRLAKDKFCVVVNDISTDNATAVLKKIEEMGGSGIIDTNDISKPEGAAALAENIKNNFGKINIIVNNAGITNDAMMDKITEQQWEDVIRINLKGPYNVVKSCLPLFKEGELGRIVNISSVAYLGNIGQSNYSASKAGVVGLTRTWALEFARRGIQVNAIAPGLIESVLTQKIPPDIKEKFIKKIPLKRIADPSEIASVISFLTSGDSSYITGQVFHVDGGLSVGF